LDGEHSSARGARGRIGFVDVFQLLAPKLLALIPLALMLPALILLALVPLVFLTKKRGKVVRGAQVLRPQLSPVWLSPRIRPRPRGRGSVGVSEPRPQGSPHCRRPAAKFDGSRRAMWGRSPDLRADPQIGAFGRDFQRSPPWPSWPPIAMKVR
jgi:hypothetical protein